MITRSIAKLILGVLALLSLICGILGLFLPLLPTTPFVILSAFLLARVDDRLHQLLYRIPCFGKALRDWDLHRGISRKSKLQAYSMIVLSMILTLVYAPLSAAMTMVLLSLLLAVLLYLYYLPECIASR